MDTKFTIKNFRVFDEEGVSFDLKPLTILTGCNSSGKSSIVKAVLLLNSFLSQIKHAFDNKEEIELSKFKLDFNKYPENTLGRFDKVVNKCSSFKKITFEYSVYSQMISKDVDVQLVFSADTNDELNNAYIESICVRINDEVFFSSNGKDGSCCNLNIIKEACMDFLPLEFIANHLSYYQPEENRKFFVDRLYESDKKRRWDILRYWRDSKKNLPIMKNWNDGTKVINWTEENGSLFMVPVIEQLDKVGKEGFLSYVENEILHNPASNGVVWASHKIANDFIASEQLTFGEYFKMKENQYLGKIFTSGIEEVNMLRIFGIKQSFFPLNPFDSVEYEVLGKDNLFREPTEEEKKEHETEQKEEMEKWEQRPVSFEFVYEIVMEWNRRVSSQELLPFYTCSVDSLSGDDDYSHLMFSMLTEFAKRLMEEVICPKWCGKVEYVSSSRANVRRLYSLETNDDFPKLLNDYFEKKRLLLGLKKDPFSEWRLEGNYEENSFINHWIKKFEIGESISFPIDKNGLGVQIRLHKETGDEGDLLADEGYGITQLVSILLQIETAILSLILMREQRRYYSGIQIKDEGYGNEVWTLAIEEPEIHLHPKYQSMLADMLVEAYKKYNVHFIVETHSEYLIRKLQVLVAGKDNEEDLQISNDEISILYVNSPKVVEETGEPQVKQIGIQEDGRLDSPFGTGFFDEADNQAMELLRIKAIGK